MWMPIKLQNAGLVREMIMVGFFLVYSEKYLMKLKEMCIHTLRTVTNYVYFVVAELFDIQMVNKTKCSLKTQKSVDREVNSKYTLTIHVTYNNGTRQKRAGSYIICMLNEKE